MYPTETPGTSKQVSVTSREVANLQKSVSELEVSFDTLSSRLMPIRLSFPEKAQQEKLLQDERKKAPEEPLSPIASDIRVLRNRIENLLGHINLVASEIQV